MSTMVRAVGVDPGTVSFDVCGVEGDHLFMDESIPSTDVAEDPQVLVDLLQSAAPVDVIVGPSGYGLPWVSAHDLRPQDVDLMILDQKRDRSVAPRLRREAYSSGSTEDLRLSSVEASADTRSAERPSPRGQTTIVGGMGCMLRSLKESGLPITFAPAVIHLPTVPGHRKVNRVDMGTADKLCAVALGIADQTRHLDIAYEETAFIYVELGGAFTAVIAVEGGKIVDGLGGTSGSLGYLAAGAMDGELAYLLGDFDKGLLCSGGVAHVAGRPDMPPEELVALIQTDDRSSMAWEAFMEGLVKSVAAEMAVVPSPREILISGRLGRIPEIRQELTARLSGSAPVRRVAGFAQVAKEAAQGAALVAEGLAGGVHARLVEVMELRAASGTVLDHLYVVGAETLRERYLQEL
jgi:predicted butyrate kinase (DUF1464 family)